MDDGFRTKTGRCVVTDEEVRLETDLREAVTGYDRSAVAVGAGVVVAVAALLVATGTRPQVVVSGVVVGGLLWLVGLAANVYRERSRVDTIPFEQIQHVTVREGRLLTLSPRFVISRDSREGDAVRYVMMHSIRFSSGREAFDRGKELFGDRGIELRGTLREGDEFQGAFEEDDEAPDGSFVAGGDDEGPTVDDIVDDVPETDGPAGIDYDRYQRVQAGEIDEELPEEFQRHFPDED